MAESIEYGKIIKKGADALSFDAQNPRLVENQENLPDDRAIQNKLWRTMDVAGLVSSILANGFFESEPLYAIIDGEKYVVIEGNRRLAAVKAILDPASIDNGSMEKYIPRITEAIREQLRTSLPVVLMRDRKEAWRFIGFKHVNGAAKWDSYAKAKYIAQVHDDYGVPLDEIALQIGDSNRITTKLYQGLMVLDQADAQTEFKKNDVYNNRIFFSHVYTAINYDIVQQYLGLSLAEVSQTPVPQEKLPNLEEFMIWVLGSRKQGLPPVVKSQNPGIRQLCGVLKSPTAIQALRNTRDLELAYDMSQEPSDVFHGSLVDSLVSLQKALSKLASYDGSRDMLNTSKELADTADDLFEAMKKKYDEKNSRGSGKRTID